MFRYSSVAAKSIRVAISINSVEFSLGLAALPPEPEGKVTKSNYSAINSWAVSQNHSEIIGLVNDDIEVITSEWLEEMASQACRPEIGAVGAMLYYPVCRIQHAGVILGMLCVANHAFAGILDEYKSCEKF